MALWTVNPYILVVYGFYVHENKIISLNKYFAYNKNDYKFISVVTGSTSKVRSNRRTATGGCFNQITNLLTCS